MVDARLTSMIRSELGAALRRIVRRPGFAAVAIVTLGIGLGAHIAIFSFIETVFLRPLDVRQSDRLVAVFESRDGEGYLPMSLSDARTCRERATRFDDLAAHYPTAPLDVEANGTFELVNGSVVESHYFPLLGLSASRGRVFEIGEDRPDSHPVAIISHQFWQRKLAAREDVIGGTITVNATKLEIIGVMPRGFRGVMLGVPSDIWLPMSMAKIGYRWCDPASSSCRFVTLLGRLKPGVSRSTAQEELDVLGDALRAERSVEQDTVRRAVVVPWNGLHPALSGAMKRLSTLMLASVSLLLLVTCANLGNMFLARQVADERTLAIRTAVGASRFRIVIAQLAETTILGLVGGTLGIGVASLLANVITRFYPSAYQIEIGTDWRVVAYALALSVTTGAIVGLVPSLRTSAPDDLSTSLRGRSSGFGASKSRLLNGIVVAQAALAFVLVAGTLLLTRSVSNALAVDGADPANIAMIRVRPRLVGYGPETSQSYVREGIERLRTLPGVESVTVSSRVPPLGGDEVDVGTAGGLNGHAWIHDAGPDFFSTFGIALLQGRDFDGRDTPDSPRVAIVNEALVNALGLDTDALRSSIVINGSEFQIVGVVRYAGYASAQGRSGPQVFVDYEQNSARTDARIFVRTDGPAAGRLSSFHAALSSIDASVPVAERRTMTDLLDESLADVHLATKVVGLSSFVTLMLAALGIYGLLAGDIARRSRDLGIRMALGATKWDITAGVVRRALRLAAMAALFGLAVSLVCGRTISAYLYDVSATDTTALCIAGAIVFFIAIFASAIPAHRAAETDPMTVIRAE